MRNADVVFHLLNLFHLRHGHKPAESEELSQRKKKRLRGNAPSPDVFMHDLLDSKQLRTFVSLAKTGSFTATAKQVFITQSAVSHSMKALEDDLGCRLLNRMGKKTTLTHEGEHLLRHAQKIIADMSSARESLVNISKTGETRLRIGASISACQHLLPDVLRQFKKQHPKCRITLEPADSPALAESVRAQQIDLALALMPHRDASLEFEPMFSDELMFIVNPQHKWVEAGGVARPEIARQNFILYSRASQTFRAVENYFQDEGIALDATMELGSIETIKELVKIGLGISVLATWIARAEIKQGTLVAMALGRRKLRRQWGILSLCGRDLTPVEKDFVKLCHEATRGLDA
jgi:DNA-binding transcriptional LysR family regulator